MVQIAEKRDKASGKDVMLSVQIACRQIANDHSTD